MASIAPWARALGALAGAWLASGCAPTCNELCQKLDRCGLDPSVGVVECRVACERELEAFKDDGDEVRLDALNAHRRCLGSSSCEDIEAGVCYDDLLFGLDVE